MDNISKDIKEIKIKKNEFNIIEFVVELNN